MAPMTSRASALARWGDDLRPAVTVSKRMGDRDLPAGNARSDPRSFVDARADLTTFVEDANWEPQRPQGGYLRNYTNAYIHNERVLQRKFRWFTFAVLMDVVALVVGTAFTIWPRA
jgi:hypothetical protein